MQRSRWMDVAGALGALALLASVAPARAQSPGVTTRASVSSAGIAGDQNSAGASLSENGRYVAFSSFAGNLVPNDGNGVSDIFVRDRLALTTERVSVASDGSEANGESFAATISADGRFVVFSSRASNLVPGDGNNTTDVFVHDRLLGETERVSLSIDGGDPDGASAAASISDDGDIVGFWSFATNLVDDDGNFVADSFVFDRETGTTERVSVSLSGGDADKMSAGAAVSGDGRWVAFTSRATNLVDATSLAPIKTGVYVRDLLTGTTRRVSQQPNGLYESGDSSSPSLSRDGRFVAYLSTSKNLTGELLVAKGRIYVTDMETGVTQLVAPDFASGDCPGGACRLLAAGEPSISADGRFVAFASSSQQVLPANYAGEQSRVYVADRLSGFLRRISVDPNHGLGSQCAVSPAISADGRVVAYRASSNDLVVDDLNGASDVFVSEWACPNTGAYASPDALPASCAPVPACPAAPASGCAAAVRSSLQIVTHPPGTDGPSRARLQWLWRGGEVPASAFGDPTDATSYALCIYAGPRGALQLEQRLDAGSAWRAAPRRLSYAADAGIEAASLRSGRHAGIRLRGSGPELDLPYLPLDARGPLLVRLHRSDGGCFAADFAAEDLDKNQAAVRRATPPHRPGRLTARIP